MIPKKANNDTLTLAGFPSGATLRPSLQIQVQYNNATNTVAKPATKITMPIFLEINNILGKLYPFSIYS